MKTYIITILISMFALSIFAQSEDEFKTIFGGKEIAGYAGLGAGYSQIGDASAFVYHGRGGLVLWHTLSIGIGGSGFATDYKINDDIGKQSSLYGGYGGLFTELTLLGRLPVHLSFPTLIGVGAVSYTTWENIGIDEYYRENEIEDIGTYFILEPGIELEFNLVKFLRVAAYLNYRFTTDIELVTITTDGTELDLINSPTFLNNYSAGLIFKFGKF